VQAGTRARKARGEDEDAVYRRACSAVTPCRVTISRASVASQASTSP
jgi:hypothetical protein